MLMQAKLQPWWTVARGKGFLRAAVLCTCLAALCSALIAPASLEGKLLCQPLESFALLIP